jgi:hypothetical protein
MVVNNGKFDTTPNHLSSNASIQWSSCLNAISNLHLLIKMATFISS